MGKGNGKGRKWKEVKEGVGGEEDVTEHYLAQCFSTGVPWNLRSAERKGSTSGIHTIQGFRRTAVFSKKN